MFGEFGIIFFEVSQNKKATEKLDKKDRVLVLTLIQE